MATKKQSLLQEELKNADLMTILSGGGTSTVFTENTLVDYSYPTGVTLLDYVNGYEVNIFDENQNFLRKRTCLGLQAGSFNVFTGKTQSFKTTIACQVIANIAYANNGNVIHYDVEQRLVLQRVKNLTKLPETWFVGERPRYKFRRGVIGFDTLQSDITEIYENKMKHKALLLKDTGEVDDQNRPIWLMPPTIVFVDSLSEILKKEYDVSDKKSMDNIKDTRDNMYGATSAKTFRGLITDIAPMLIDANIILIVVAHKTSAVNANPFAPQPKQFQYGNNNERIAGGSALEHGASALVNLTGLVSADSRYHMDTDGFEGNTVLYEPTKSSTNESGNEKTGLGFNIIIDKRREGVDNVRTLIKFLEQRGKLKGNKAGWRVIDSNGEPISGKFTWKNVYDDFKYDQATYKTFMLTAKEELETLIAKAPVEVSGAIKVFNVNDIVNGFDTDVA